MRREQGVSELPAPPVPADVDLRGMPYMQLFGDRLFKSTTWIEARPEARCATLQLYWHAFAHEVPAASLPDHERVLADHAGLSLKVFRRVRDAGTARLDEVQRRPSLSSCSCGNRKRGVGRARQPSRPHLEMAGEKGGGDGHESDS